MTRDAFLIRNRLWILLFLTTVAGVMRFATLTRPPLWGDEAFTYYRTAGDFQDLLNILQFDGFPPLHYEAYWALRQAHKLTPRLMRMIPATAGTLMVPAMYFLAVQLVRKRVALLVAAFTACSAYMMVYSHDAKMYMACWLFVSLHVGCLLWWLRVGRSPVGRVAWLSWTACGVAAAGLHHSANLVLPMELIVLLTCGRGALTPALGRRIVLFLLGVVLIGSGPAGYLLGFNHLVEKADEQPFGYGRETAWVESYNLGRTPADLALFTATAHLYSWEWPQNSARRAIDPDLLHGLMAVGVVLMALIAAGTLRWVKPRRAAVMYDSDPPAKAWWRLYLWLGTWIVAIGFGAYCASVKHFQSPGQLIAAAGGLLGGHWLVLAAAWVVLASAAHAWPRFPRYLAAALPIATAFSLFVAVLHGFEKLSAAAEWHARYWSVLAGWWQSITASTCVVMAAAALPVVAWHFAGSGVRERAIAAGEFLAVSLVILAACWGAWGVFHVRFLSAVAKLRGAPGLAGAAAEEAAWAKWLSVWMPRYVGVFWPAVAIATCALLVRLPGRPLRYAAVVILLGANLAQATARLVAGTEPPSDRIATDVVASQEGGGGAATRAYFIGTGGISLGAPGTLSIFSHQTGYYFSQAATRPAKPRDLYRAMVTPTVASTLKTFGLKLWTDYGVAGIADEVKRTPALRRVIVWERLDKADAPGVTAGLGRALGEGWRPAGDRTFHGRDHWTWTDLWVLRRREYERVGPTTAP